MVTVSCGGDAFDPRSTDNTLSLQVMQSAAEEISYSFDPDAPEKNKAKIRIKTQI